MKKQKHECQIYLERIPKLNAMIQNKTAEAEQWRNISLGVTPQINSERVQSSGSKQKMADAIDRFVDLQEEINSLIDNLVDTKKEIISNIEQLPAMEYDVLHKRYIQGMQFDEIGATRGKSKSWATTIHGNALQHLKVILSGEK